MSDHASNTTLVAVAKLLGLEARYFAGSYTLRNGAEYLGQMSAEDWLAHFRQKCPARTASR